MPRTDLEGSAIKALDEKDRVGIPSRHTRWLTNEVVLAPGPSHHIEVRGLGEWEEYKAKLNARAARGPRQRKELLRHIVGHAQHVRIDGQGRIRVNADLLDWAKVAPRDSNGQDDSPREVKLIGMGDYLEIWSVSTYEKRRRELEVDFEATFDEMMMADEPAIMQPDETEGDGAE